jgi:hypothetical protein
LYRVESFRRNNPRLRFKASRLRPNLRKQRQFRPTLAHRHSQPLRQPTTCRRLLRRHNEDFLQHRRQAA